MVVAVMRRVFGCVVGFGVLVVNWIGLGEIEDEDEDESECGFGESVKVEESSIMVK